MRLGEALFFLCLATGLHAAVWQVSPGLSGASASGASGADAQSVQAASAAQQAMVAAWQRPPTALSDMPVMQPPPPVAAVAPPAPSLASPVALPKMPDLTTRGPAPRVPDVDTAPATPAPAARPKMRPAALSTAAQNQTARQAAGTGQHAQKGTGGTARTQAETAQRTHALRAAWGSHIHEKVQRHMRYPRGASASGTAKLALTVAPTGTVEDVRLVRSSGDARLDKAAFDAVKRAGKFADAPAGLAEPKYAFSLSLTFTR